MASQCDADSMFHLIEGEEGGNEEDRDESDMTSALMTAMKNHAMIPKKW